MPEDGWAESIAIAVLLSEIIVLRGSLQSKIETAAADSMSVKIHIVCAIQVYSQRRFFDNRKSILQLQKNT